MRSSSAPRHEGPGIPLTPRAIGLAVGLALAAGVANLMSSQLFGIQALDPLTFATAAAVLAAVGMVASFVPALRALGVDPVDVLRYE